jgi:ribosome-associated protein
VTTTPSSAPPLDGLELAHRCVELALDKKAVEPVILDLQAISTITDYLVICSAQSEPQLKAIANGVVRALKDDFARAPYAVDGFPASQWVVVDYGEVMLHIFHQDKRGVYALEDLWNDAKKVRLPGVG